MTTFSAVAYSPTCRHTQSLWSSPALQSTRTREQGTASTARQPLKAPISNTVEPRQNPCVRLKAHGFYDSRWHDQQSTSALFRAPRARRRRRPFGRSRRGPETPPPHPRHMCEHTHTYVSTHAPLTTARTDKQPLGASGQILAYGSEGEGPRGLEKAM